MPIAVAAPAPPPLTSDATATPTVLIKLPWTFVFGGVGALGLFLVVLWASVNKLTDEVRELKGAVQAGTSITASLQQDLRVLTVRQDITERTITAIQAVKAGKH